MATTAEPRVFATIQEALEDFRAGKFMVVVDAPDREHQGDLTIAAEFATYLPTKRAKLGHRLHHQDLRFETDEQ